MDPKSRRVTQVSSRRNSGNQMSKLRQTSSIVLVTLAGQLIRTVHAKGGSVRGAAAGAPVCTECHGNYTEEEMQLALIILFLIMVISVVVCACQCYQRVIWEYTGHKAKRPMPMAPYDREDSRFNMV